VSGRTEATIRADVVPEAFDFEAVFRTHYRRIARVIVRVIQDPSRAEELAVEVFWKLWRHSSAHGPQCGGWLHRTAVRVAIDELRRRSRREKYEQWFGASRQPDDPERSHAAEDERKKVRRVLAALRSQDAQMIALRAEGLSYDELALTLNLNPASIGTMLRRAHESFRKEYVKRYGDA
jgi:RNA polymerase sigma-70 factor, ECF subfamily